VLPKPLGLHTGGWDTTHCVEVATTFTVYKLLAWAALRSLTGFVTHRCSSSEDSGFGRFGLQVQTATSFRYFGVSERCEEAENIATFDVFHVSGPCVFEAPIIDVCVSLLLAAGCAGHCHRRCGGCFRSANGKLVSCYIA
jgi:hypothetical protein